MFEDLSEKLEATFARLRGRGVLSEADIKEGLREVRRVLLEADVNFQLTREFLERVEKKATGVNALSTVSPGQQLVKIVHEELTAMLGERREGLKLGTVPPSVVMMVGLQGSGKTTTAAKLARKLKAEGRSTRLVAADVYRPAAIDQLETLGRDLGIPVYADRTTTDVVKIARAGVAEALRERDRVVIIDTAGRLQIDDDDDAGALAPQGSASPVRNSARRRRNDGTGRGEDRAGIRRGSEHDRRDADEDGRRCPRRRGALDLRGYEKADQVHRCRREVRRAGGIPSRANGGADPPEGRHRHAGRESAGVVRRSRSEATGEEGSERREWT